MAGSLRDLAPALPAEPGLHAVREGHGGDDPAAGAHGLPQGLQRAHEIGDVLEHVEGGKGVEGGVGEVLRDVVDVAHEGGNAQGFLDVAHGAGVEIDAGDLEARLLERDHAQPPPASHVEDGGMGAHVRSQEGAEDARLRQVLRHVEHVVLEA